MISVTIEVTQKDIDKAIALDKTLNISVSKRCPVALAAQRTFNNFEYWAAGNFIKIGADRNTRYHTDNYKIEALQINFDLKIYVACKPIIAIYYKSN